MTNMETEISKAIKLAYKGKKTVEWKDIVESVNKSGVAIKNWMLVRNILQGSFINKGKLARTSNLRDEIYKVS